MRPLPHGPHRTPLIITRRQHPLLKELRDVRDHPHADLLFLEGPKLVDEALRGPPETEAAAGLRPPLNPIDRLWKVRWRRAAHDRLSDALADLKKSLRSSWSYFQTVCQRVKTLLEKRRRRANK